MRRVYEKPIFEKVEFDYQDILTASGAGEKCISRQMFGDVATIADANCTERPVGAPMWNSQPS